MARKDVLHNSREIERYLEQLLPKLEPKGGIPEAPMSRKERGSSRPPVSPYVMSLWKSNPHLGRVNKTLREAAKASDDVSLVGRPMWEILGDTLFNHTAIRTWKNEGGIDEKRFYQMCCLLAQMLAMDYDTPQGPYRITIYTEPTDEPQPQRTHKGIRANTRYTQRRMIEQLEEVEEEFPHLRKMECMEILSDRKKREGKDWTVRRLREARTYVNKLRANDVA